MDTAQAPRNALCRFSCPSTHRFPAQPGDAFGCEGQVGARQGQPFLEPWVTVAARGIGSGHGRRSGVTGPSRGLRPRSASLLFGHICPLQPPAGFQAINPGVWPCESRVRRGSERRSGAARGRWAGAADGLRPAPSLMKHFLYQNRCFPGSGPREEGVAAPGLCGWGCPAAHRPASFSH